MLQIEEMFAFIAKNKDGEGVMGASLPIGGQMMMTALVGADIARIQQLLPIAKEISKITGTPFRIVKFSNRKDITDQIEAECLASASAERCA